MPATSVLLSRVAAGAGREKLMMGGIDERA